MLAEYLTLWHLKMLVLYILANCAPVWFVIWRNKRLRPDPKRDIEKYKPFVREDMANLSYLSCIWTHMFFWPRYLYLLLILFYAAITTFIFTLGADI
jgi:1-acyl-sn-glycerol-3-phosphate acyltransferase